MPAHPQRLLRPDLVSVSAPIITSTFRVLGWPQPPSLEFPPCGFSGTVDVPGLLGLLPL